MSKSGRQITQAEASAILERLQVGRWVAAGSYRRGLELVNDIDLVVRTEDLEDLRNVMVAVCDEVARLKKDNAIVGGFVGGVAIELYEAKAGCFGATLLHATGSKEFNVECRKLAKIQGRILSQYGLRERATGERLDDDTEEGILKLLGLPWVPPEKR